jgi:hypothetical protein
MAQAINIVPPSAVIATLARRAAVDAIKQQVRATGAKWSELSCRTINELASVYLEANRQALIEQAIETIAKSPTLRKYYEREQRDRAKLNKNAQTENEPKSVTSAVQNSSAEWSR